MIDKKKLVNFILEQKILTFGDFITNSGRKSSYFCNFGHLSKPGPLRELSSFYADEIIATFGSKVDNVFGPAYKGISLAIMIADSLSTKLGKEVSFTFNRKEKKDHGEKGLFLGHSYEGGENTVIVEDVITSGKSLFSAFDLLKQFDINVMGAVVCVDREENALEAEEKAKGFWEQKNKRPMKALLSIKDLLQEANPSKALLCDNKLSFL